MDSGGGVGRGGGRRVARIAAGCVVVAAAGAFLALWPWGGGEQRAREVFDERARAVAQAWSDPSAQQRWRTSVVALEATTREPTWGSREDLRNGLRGGWGRVAGTLPAGPGQGTVRFPDGSDATTRVVAAQDALDLALAEVHRTCPSACGEPVVTSARLTTTSLLTGRGTATVPAWAFSIDGIPDPLVRVAVPLTDPSSLRPTLLASSGDLPRLLQATREVGREGRSLTVAVEAPDCARDVRLRVHETDRVVVVGGTVGRPSSRTCAAVMVEHEQAFTLSAPVGERPVVTVTGDVVLPGEVFVPPSAAR